MELALTARPGPWIRLALAAVAVVLVVLVAVLPSRLRGFDRFLSGFWVGDPVFLQEAGLSEMYLFIAPGRGPCREGYLVMVGAAGEMVSNQGVGISCGGLAGRWRAALGSHFAGQEVYRVPRVRIAYDDEEVMPDEVCLGLDPAEGTLALYGRAERKLYAFLVRDNETSIAAVP